MMAQVNPGNEKLKRRYITHMKEARGSADSTVDHALRAILEYERFTGFLDFNRFGEKSAIAYKKSLFARGGKGAAERSSRSTIRTKLQLLQRFLKWLAEQPGFRTKIRFGDIEFLNLSNRDIQIVRDRAPKLAPTVEQVRHAILTMPCGTDLELRDRAVVCLALLTGARVMAIATLKLRHVRPDRRGINQDGLEVRTKFSKSAATFWYPVGADIEDMFLEYADHLRHDLMFNDNDPLFPSTRQETGEACYFHTVGMTRLHWRSPDPVRRIFRRAFEGARLPYYPPHTIRSTLALLGERMCQSPEELKAWSQNLSHNSVLTTLASYGRVPEARQMELMMAMDRTEPIDDAVLSAAVKSLRSDQRFQIVMGLKGRSVGVR